MSEEKVEPSYFSMGQHTLQVPMTLFEENRKKLRYSLYTTGDKARSIVFVESGNTTGHYNTDMEYVFRPEPYFFWLFGVTEPGFYGALDIFTGKSYLFLPCINKEYSIWMGNPLTPEEAKRKYKVDKAFYEFDIIDVLTALESSTLLLLRGQNADSSLLLEAPFEELPDFNVDFQTLYPQITSCRVLKSHKEIEVMRYVCKITCEAHKNVMCTVKPGMYEYQAEAAFIHYCYTVGGCRHTAFTSMCGTGLNTAIFMYGHAGAPNNGKIEDGDLCLFSMGASYYGYSADVACTFPANGEFTEKQKVVYNAVLEARNAVLEVMQPGLSWVDLHLLATKAMLLELREHNIVKGDIKQMLEADLGAVFLPHGLGHLIGLDVHDVGGYTADTPERPTRPALCTLRTARVLEANMVITVEPGCYFIDEILDEALENKILSRFLNGEVIEGYRGMGGVRIGDVVVVTEHGIDNLTTVPRTVDHIERYMLANKLEVPAIMCR